MLLTVALPVLEGRITHVSTTLVPTHSGLWAGTIHFPNAAPHLHSLSFTFLSFPLLNSENNQSHKAHGSYHTQDLINGLVRHIDEPQQQHFITTALFTRR